MITIDNNDWCMGPLSSGHHYGVGPTGDDCWSSGWDMPA